LPTSVGPLVLPMGPEIVAAPQPKVSLNLGQSMYTAGTRPVGPQVSTIGHHRTSVAYRYGYSAGPNLLEFGATDGAHVCAR